MQAPPYRIETSRLVLRCWDPRDAPALAEAVTSSLEHLRPWMPWAHGEPTSLDDRIALLRRFRGNFDRDEDYVYGVFARDGETVLGGSGLHRRHGDEALEIGYWIRASAAGRGLATELSAALTRVAFAVSQVERVEIRVDPANAASCRVPEKLGYVREATLRRRLPPQPGEERRDAVVFTMLAQELPGSAAEALSEGLVAFDPADRMIDL